ncbi:MAG: patatin-like phospholipase family protein [Actinomycetota bacterium]|nr:patatin-like phospholipase family protein [Actinomycetota bacterium]
MISTTIWRTLRRIGQRQEVGPVDADLVLEGGGVKGIGLVGAYSVLHDAGYEFNRVAGTSAGAIVGALIAAGMPPDRMREVMREVDYGKFQDEGFLDHLGVVGKGLSVLFEKGIYEGDYLRDWLDALLTDLGKRTFAALKVEDPGSSLPPEKSYKLVVMASDVSRGELARFPWDYPSYGLDPDQQLVADAVRASMSIPFFYEPVRLHWRGSDGIQTESFLVDGGMLSNFPMEVFDRTDGRTPRWPSFGIKLSARPRSVRAQKFRIDGTFDLARAMIGTMTGFHDQMHIDDECVLKRLMFVDSGSTKATDFDLDETTQDLLFENGRAAATKFLSSWNFKAYLETCRSADVSAGAPGSGVTQEVVAGPDHGMAAVGDDESPVPSNVTSADNGA